MRVKQWLTAMAIAAVALISTSGGVLAQQAQKPLATIVISPIEQTVKDIAWLMSAVNAGQTVAMFEWMAESYTEGIDKTKPLGVLLSMEDNQPKPLVCLPVTDHKKFFGALANMGIEPDDLGNGMYEFPVGPQMLYTKVQDGWMFVGQTEESVQEPPKNPAEMFGDYAKRYNMTVKIDMQQLPEDLKGMAIENMRKGFESAMAQQGQTDEQREMGEAQLDQLEELINSTQQLVVGWLIDSAKQQVHFDGAIQYLSGTKMAKQMDSQAKLKSEFTGLVLPEAAGEFRFTSLMTNEGDKALTKQSLRNSLEQAETQLENSNAPEEVVQLLQKFMSSFADIFDKTIDEGSLDGAVSVSVAGDKLQVVAGARVADGHAVENELKELINGLPKNENVVVEFDKGKHNGFNLHRISAKLTNANEEARAAFGEQVQLYVAGGDKAVIVCLDPKGDAGIKAAIDGYKSKPATEVSPAYAIVRLTNLLRFAQQVSPNPMLENAINTMGQFSGKDTIQFKSTLLPRGVVTRLTIDEGVLRTAGSAAMMVGGARGNPGF